MYILLIFFQMLLSVSNQIKPGWALLVGSSGPPAGSLERSPKASSQSLERASSHLRPP